MSITTRGLIAHFDIKKNGKNDIVGTYGFNLTSSGGVMQSLDSLVFDGVSGIAEFKSSTTISSRFQTIEVVISSPFDGEAYTGSNNDALMIVVNSTNIPIAIDKSGRVVINNIEIGKLEQNKKQVVTVVYESITGTRNDKLHYYINGVKKMDIVTASDRADTNIAINNITLGGLQPTFIMNLFKGSMYSVKNYNVMLSDTEIYSNYQAEIIEQEEPPIDPDDDKAPTPTVISVSRDKISDEPTMNKSNITFRFDVDVSQWSVNVNGASHTTGVVADLGGTVSAGVEIVAEIDWTELYQEGQNRVNIYGRSVGGIWTPYTSDVEDVETGGSGTIGTNPIDPVT
jgi:hypothetical protein